ncbi:MAG TPA: sigma-70 family RNA polymerase sigma factor [Thermoleophilaceae bacterium]|nr:sigma-70 family RNA polymerase sigma factor [Thermoleophilaceae bacterium]
MTALASHTGFSAAYREHRQLAFSAAQRVLGDVAAAEDVVQDVFTALWRNPSKFDPRRGSLPGYVAMMARSRAVDRVRSRNAGAAAVERLGVRDADRGVTEDSPAERVVSRDDAGRVLAVLGELPPAQRDAVLLAYGRGLSTAEIARAAGVPLGTAKSRLRLGLQRTRAALQVAPDTAAAPAAPDAAAA